MFFGPDEFPWSVLGCVLGLLTGGIVVLIESSLEIICLADIEAFGGIFKNIDPKHRQPQEKLPE
jgi:hypothetical protein